MYEKPTQENLDKMFDYIQEKMTPDKFMPIKTDLAFDTIKMLMSEKIIDNCVLSNDELSFVKISNDYNEKMFNYISNLDFEKWIDISSEVQAACIKLCFKKIDGLEFNADYSKFRKVNMNFIAPKKND